MGHAFDTTMVPALALAATLGELASLLERTTELDYLSRPPGGVSGSVGAHVRHCLDHVQAVLDRSGDGVMTYDRRRRDTPVEHSRTFGISALREVAVALRAMAARPADEPLTLEAQVDRDGGRVQVTSSIGRELVFVLQHTIHHQALVALLLADRGVLIPPQFGYAPSTVRCEGARVHGCEGC
jgi:uncharacterized damage-inducible protein DinB